MNGKLLTVAEAADALHMKPSSLRAWVLRRKINCYKVGRSIRISTDEIERLLREGLRPAKEPLEKGGKYR